MYAKALVVCAIAGGAVSPLHAAQTPTRLFFSPSKNIQCAGQARDADGRPSASCHVVRHHWARTPPKPAACDLDWVPTTIGILLGAPYAGECRGDVPPELCGIRGFEPCRPLAYGRSLRFGGIRCRSLRSGMECRYVGGHRRGFLVAYGGYRLYRRGPGPVRH